MTLAHISDTHLGYRAYGRTTSLGFNQREVDVMKTFETCLDSIAQADPDLVVHAGDLFHVVRPSNATIVKAYQLLVEFQRKRDGKPFVLIGGNHDTPRTSDSGNLLRLFESIPGFVVKTEGAEAVAIDELDAEVLCVPNNSLARHENVDYLPVLGRKYSVLVLHGMARSLVPEVGEFDVEDTHHERWTYVALGDYHVHQPYGRNVCYAGATDYTSTNPWEERHKPKGWVWFDSAGGALRQVPVSTRPVLDLAPIDAGDLTPDELADTMRAAAVWPDEPAPIVRQIVKNVRPEMRAQLGLSVLREIGLRALSYHVPFIPATRPDADGEGERPIAASLEASWKEHVGAASLAANVSREALRDLGLQLLAEVAELEADPIEA
jgi:DNA repair protein SbcD/Mre11